VSTRHQQLPSISPSCCLHFTFFDIDKFLTQGFTRRQYWCGRRTIFQHGIYLFHKVTCRWLNLSFSLIYRHEVRRTPPTVDRSDRSAFQTPPPSMNLPNSNGSARPMNGRQYPHTGQEPCPPYPNSRGATLPYQPPPTSTNHQPSRLQQNLYKNSSRNGAAPYGSRPSAHSVPRGEGVYAPQPFRAVRDGPEELERQIRMMMQAPNRHHELATEL